MQTDARKALVWCKGPLLCLVSDPRYVPCRVKALYSDRFQTRVTFLAGFNPTLPSFRLVLRPLQGKGEMHTWWLTGVKDLDLATGAHISSQDWDLLDLHENPSLGSSHNLLNY